MKVKPRTFQIMWDTHSVCGIFIGLALFVIFFTGAFTLFRDAILVWEEPSLRTSTTEVASLDSLTREPLDALSSDGTTTSYVYLRMPTEYRSEMYLYAADGTEPEKAWVNPETGEWVAGASHATVSTLIYYLHFFYQLDRWGMYLAGIIGLFTMLAITTGVIIHLHRLVKDFFQFRPGKKLRVAWADAHKVLGTIGIPFQLMYAFTGTFYCLLILVVLPYTMLLFDGDVSKLYQRAGYSPPHVTVDSVETPGGSASLDRIASKAEATWPGFEIHSMSLHNYGKPNAHVEVVGGLKDAAFGGSGTLLIHGVTGEVLAKRNPRQANVLNESVHVIEALHFATFGGTLLKVLFFFLALGSCAVILTGNLTWLEVRHTQDRAVVTVLSRLTAGVATGMVPATALLFLADRWMPAAVANPGWWANVAFFGSWAACVLYALVRSNVARTHRALLVMGGTLALLIPLANGLTTGDWLWVAWGAGYGSVLGVDVGTVLCGVGALGIAACLDVDAGPPATDSATADQNGERQTMPQPNEMAVGSGEEHTNGSPIAETKGSSS